MSIQDFTQLDVWQEACALTGELYAEARRFPVGEGLPIGDQLRRAAVSLPTNIAEGFSRPTERDRLRFYRTALASLDEVRGLRLLAETMGYLDYEGPLTERLSVLARRLQRLCTVIRESIDRNSKRRE
jgi:four helix bundle protein